MSTINIYQSLSTKKSIEFFGFSTKPKTEQQIVFIDSHVEDYQSLATGVSSEIEVVILHPNDSGIEQIAKVIKKYPQISSIHIVSHGSPGCVELGNSQLNIDSINSSYAEELETWSVTNIFLYGCSVAAGDTGTEFLEKLHQLTGANVAASATPTGSTALGGDWELEVSVGELKVDIPFTQEIQRQWNYVLTPFEQKPVLYQVISGELRQLNPLTGGYEEIGGILNTPTYNAGGYNINDDYIYAFEKGSGNNHKLLRINSTGTVEYVRNDATVTTDSTDSNIFTVNLNPNPTGGDIDDNNNLWVTNVDSKTSIIRINLNNPITSTTINFNLSDSTFPTGDMPVDLTYIANNSFYGVSGDGTLVTIDVSNPSNVKVDTKPITDGVGNLAAGAYGAAWTDKDGKLYASNNTGQLYHIRDFTTPTPEVEQVLPTITTNSNDGMSDPRQVSIFDIPQIDLSGTDDATTN